MKSYTGGIRHDYKDSASGAPAIDRRGLSWFAVGLALPLAALVLFLISEPNESMVPPPGSETEPMRKAVAGPPPGERTAVAAPPPGERLALELPPPATLRDEPDEPATSADLEREALLSRGDLLSVTVENGDSLDLLFRRNDLSISDLARMIDLPEAGRELARVRPGDEIRIVHEESRVLALTKQLDELSELWIELADSGYSSKVVDLDVETRTVGAHGVIETSLFEASANAGISDAVTMKMADSIFAWDIDFTLEVRTGDSFTVVYEELWRDGEKLRDGEIIVAEFVNRGEVFRAARYVDASGDVDYYTPEGLSVRKAFMRNPIPIVRVSSGFNPNRRHPILNTIRAHRGVDYAAPTGTRVFAAADGKVASRGVNGGYGNAVVLEHGGNITTLYAHLSRFGKHGAGARVKQGDVIGYVGATGQATGPHLHYEYRVGGVHRNPQTVDLPPADPIADEYRGDFELASAKLWRQLDLYHGTQLAAVTD